MLTDDSHSESVPEVVGVVPMAGRAARLAPLPFSKELYPAGMRSVGRSARPKVVSHYLLEQLQRAGASRAFLVLRAGKWDIPAYFLDGSAFVDLRLGYLLAASSDGLPHSLDAASSFVKGCTVAMGFPDVLTSEPSALQQVAQRQLRTGADVVLGLFPWSDPLTDDMVGTDSSGRVSDYYVRGTTNSADFTWSFLAWGPAFTRFLHEYVVDWDSRHAGHELALGEVLREALAAGLLFDSVAFPRATFLDLGTPEGLARLPGFLLAHTRL